MLVIIVPISAGGNQARIGGKECAKGKPAEEINGREKGSSDHRKVGSYG